MSFNKHAEAFLPIGYLLLASIMIPPGTRGPCDLASICAPFFLLLRLFAGVMEYLSILSASVNAEIEGIHNCNLS